MEQLKTSRKLHSKIKTAAGALNEKWNPGSENDETIRKES